MEEFKEQQRAIWDSGDYAALSEYISQVGELVVERAGVGAGMDVLDVAAARATRPCRRPGPARR